MTSLVVTIDGPAASGKSTVAKTLAEKLNASFLDTGAMYRAVTLTAMDAEIDIENEKKLLDFVNNTKIRFVAQKNSMRVWVNDIDVTEKIRQPEVTANARYIAASPKIREKLVQMQRDFAAAQKKIVTEGRDQGTVAFPNAHRKFFLTADVEERARRRQAEIKDKGENQTLEQIQKAIERRDKSDEDRTVGPLKPADDAVIIDTTNLTVEEVVKKILSYMNVDPEKALQKSSPKKPLMIWFIVARFFCRIFCKLFFKMEVYGLENVPKKGPFLLTSNHQSFIDPLFCGVCLKPVTFFLARDTLFTNWFFRRLLTSVNAIPVRRGTAHLSAMKKIISKLKDGFSVCLFPEATRTSDGRIARLKSGFGLICRRGNAALVPVVIEGAFECWPRNKKIFIPGKKIVVCYGRPIKAEEIKNMDDKQLAEIVTGKMRQMQKDCRIKLGKEPFEYDD